MRNQRQKQSWTLACPSPCHWKTENKQHSTAALATPFSVSQTALVNHSGWGQRLVFGYCIPELRPPSFPELPQRVCHMVAITSVQPISLPAFPTNPFFLPAQEVRGLQHLLHLRFPHIRCSGEISEPAEALQQLFFFSLQQS